MLEVGYGNDDDKRLEEKLEMARARYAELKAKVAEKEKEQSEMEPERGADDSAKGRRKKPKKAPKKGRKQSKRSSSRRRKSSRKWGVETQYTLCSRRQQQHVSITSNLPSIFSFKNRKHRKKIRQ